MPDPRRPLPPDRPDPAVLLIDAVIQRQQMLALRLAQQWVHRRGLASFESLLNTTILSSCGEEALAWLKQSMERPAAAASSDHPVEGGGPAAPLQQLLRDALVEAIAPLRDAQSKPQEPVPQAIRSLTVVPQTTDDPWTLPELETPRTGTSPKAAPAPADLAGLRAWLHSDAA